MLRVRQGSLVVPLDKLIELQRASLGSGDCSRAELYLDERIASVRQLEHGVCLEPCVVTVVHDPGAAGLGVGEQVAQHQVLEHVAERVEVVVEVLRSEAEGRDADGWVDEHALL